MKKYLLLLSLVLPAVLLFGQKSKADSLLSLIAKSGQDTTRVNFLNELSSELDRSNPDTALILAREALALSEKMGYQKGKGKALHYIGHAYFRKGDYGQSLNFYLQALEHYRQHSHETDIAKAQHSLANAYFSLGDYEKAAEMDSLVIATGKRTNNDNLIADGLINLGNVNFSSGNFDQSLDNYLSALKIKEKYNEQGSIITIYNNMAGIYYHLEDYARALEMAENTLENYKMRNDKDGTAIAYSNMGRIYIELDSVQTALRYFHLSLETTESTGHKPSMAEANDNIGTVYDQLGDFKKGLGYHLKALELSREAGYLSGMADALCNLGGSYTSQGEYGKAFASLTQALEVAEKMGSNYNRKNAYDLFIELYKKEKDLPNVIRYMELSAQMKDSMMSEQNAENLNMLQVRFETEKKEKEIALLQKDKNINELQLENEKNFRYSLYGGLVLLVIFGVFMFNRWRITRDQKKIIEEQKQTVEAKNKEITDSIQYAKRIQQSLFPTEKYIERALKKK